MDIAVIERIVGFGSGWGATDFAVLRQCKQVVIDATLIRSVYALGIVVSEGRPEG